MKAVAFRMLRNSRTCPFPPSLVPSRDQTWCPKATKQGDEGRGRAEFLHLAFRCGLENRPCAAYRGTVRPAQPMVQLASIIEGLNEVFHDEGYDISIYQMSSTEERKRVLQHAPGAPQRRRRHRHFLRHRQQRNRTAQVDRRADHRHQLKLAGRTRLQRGRPHRRQAGFGTRRTPS